MSDKTFDKKKILFWRVAFVFAALTITVLIILWNSPREQNTQMMEVSMGNMMKQMHVSNITIYDLMRNMEIPSQKKAQISEMHSHHQGQATVIYKLNFLSTATVFLLLPFIIGGAVILAIVWKR